MDCSNYIQSSSRGVGVSRKERECIFKGLFLENQATVTENYKSLQRLVDPQQERDYVMRNARALGMQSTSVQEEQHTGKNQIEIQLQKMLKIEELINEHRLGAHRTEELENRLVEIRNVISKQARWGLEDTPIDLTVRAVESKKVIGPCSTNMGL